MKEPKKKKHNYVSDHTENMDISNASSAQECTGLIPSQPQSGEEYESYQAVYDFAPPNSDVKEMKNKK